MPFAPARSAELTAHVVWLLVPLLVVPLGSLGVSVSRCMASESECPVPVSAAEEEREEARLESHGWELVNRSRGPNPSLLLPQSRLALSMVRLQEIGNSLQPAALLYGSVMRC